MQDESLRVLAGLPAGAAPASRVRQSHSLLKAGRRLDDSVQQRAVGRLCAVLPHLRLLHLHVAVRATRFSSTESGFRMSPVFVHDAGQDHAADSLRDLPGIGGTSQLSCELVRESAGMLVGGPPHDALGSHRPYQSKCQRSKQNPIEHPRHWGVREP